MFFLHKHSGLERRAMAALQEAGEAASSALWKLIEDRRREPTVSREGLERTLAED
jgi:hypothetical protein